MHVKCTVICVFIDGLSFILRIELSFNNVLRDCVLFFQSALEMVRFQLRHGNDLLAMDSIRNCDVSFKYLVLDIRDI